MKWITRSNIKVDRVARAWLIRRFLDPEAEFLFVDEANLLETAARQFPVCDALYCYAQTRERG